MHSFCIKEIISVENEESNLFFTTQIRSVRKHLAIMSTLEEINQDLIRFSEFGALHLLG
jgi:hypothetical protein